MRGLRGCLKHDYPYHIFDLGILGPLNMRVLYSENVLIGTGFAFVPERVNSLGHIRAHMLRQ